MGVGFTQTEVNLGQSSCRWSLPHARGELFSSPSLQSSLSSLSRREPVVSPFLVKIKSPSLWGKSQGNTRSKSKKQRREDRELKAESHSLTHQVLPPEEGIEES